MAPESVPTHQAIADAATELFVANGYHGTSMRQIAQAAGVALGSIYNHFASKEEIFTAIIRERHPINRLIPLLQEAEGRTAEELIRDGAHRMAAAMGENQAVLRLVFVEMVEFDGRHIAQLFDDLFPGAAAFIQRLAQVPGNLRPHSPTAILRGFFGLLFSHVVLEMLLVNTPLGNGEQILDELLDIFLHGVLSE